MHSGPELLKRGQNSELKVPVFDEEWSSGFEFSFGAGVKLRLGSVNLIRCIHRGRSWSQEIFADYEGLFIKYCFHGKFIGGSWENTFWNLQQVYLLISMSFVYFIKYFRHKCNIFKSLKASLPPWDINSSHFQKYEFHEYISQYLSISLWPT